MMSSARKKRKNVISFTDSEWGIKEKKSKKRKKASRETGLLDFVRGKPKPTGRPDYGIRKEKEAKPYLRRRFSVPSTGRKLRRSPASHGPADWEVVDKSGKIVGLIQVKASRAKGGARISSAERERLIETAKFYNTRAFLTKCERGHYTTIQIYPKQQKKDTRKKTKK